jgi:hypothetical protein
MRSLLGKGLSSLGLLGSTPAAVTAGVEEPATATRI